MSEELAPEPEDRDTAPAGESELVRSGLEDVRRLLARLVPDAACRHRMLEYLADAILVAHEVGANRWAVTLNKGRVRLNVGNYLAYEIGRESAFFTLERSLIDPVALAQLQQLPRWDSWQFKSYPKSVTCDIGCSDLEAHQPLIRAAHEAFIRNAANQLSQVRSHVRDAHVDPVIEYLREQLGRDIPYPEYGLSGTSGRSLLSDIDREAIIAACEVFDRERRATSYWQNWERDPAYRYVFSWQGQRYPVKEVMRIASGVERFSGSYARRMLTQLGFGIETLANTTQQIWLFQANPRYYDLAERVASAAVGDEDVWTVTRYREEMDAGEAVVLWLAGAQAGIYAIGELTGAPAQYTYADDELPSWLTPNPDGPTSVWRVPFRYTHVLPEPIRKPTIQEHPILQQMMVLRVPNNTNFKLTDAEWEAIQTLLDRAPSPSPAKHNAEYSLGQCALETGVDEVELRRWLRAIERKGQAVLYGPPGTGKTFIAQRLARHLVGGGDGVVDLVQFHPAYTYEDFIQGIRPQSQADGSLSYPVVPGRFLDFCARARAVTDTCVLIIDEINRANLARVFGELMYLLEYRDQSLPLAGGGVLSIPPNVRIIGTMNTADRSIALVDHALRRRFAFLPLQPNYQLLRSFHDRAGFAAGGLIDVLEELNGEIGDPSYAVGISFFMRNRLSVELEDIWRMEIEPYLEEYFFDRREVVERFRWPTVARRVLP